MKRARIAELTLQYRHALLDDIIPFWLKHGLDHECGGFFHVPRALMLALELLEKMPAED